MKFNNFGKLKWKVSQIGLGTWQVGGGWGKEFDPKLANKLIHTALDQGVNFIDTADVYDQGLSEAAVGKAVRERSEWIYVATKCGRQINPHVAAGYTSDALRFYVESSLKNMGLDCIDLIQWHCPPSEVFLRDDLYELFERLIAEGKVRAMGVSVEKVSEAEEAMKHEVVSSIQIIFNMFRLKPGETLFERADIKDFGIIARVPLASGLLTGKFNRDSQFRKDDHRFFNRQGEAFDKGETFSGVDYETGLKAVSEIQEIFKGNESLASWALRWVLMFSAVSTVIPGASSIEQIQSNVQAASLPSITEAQMAAVKKIYDQYFRETIHPLW